ncbi:pseudouridine synthase [Corynascus novoguineensis]|uniref:Pseudouridine synthase n=1 Tax=Corynascus novoguineensis TaxID=1126955 RepID=A0AAN7HEZ7_9PEZI|nr:pseudouridine synthase [Corynascus novoguineensis]
MADNPVYQNWSRDQLLERVKELEQQLESQEPGTQPHQGKQKQKQQQTSAAPPSLSSTSNTPRVEKKKKASKKPSKLDPSKYSTRFVALKLAYLGKRYGGFEYQAGVAVPTVEEELWKALVRSCLIWPDDPARVDFGPWEYSKCGRTDRGVSAFGQVDDNRKPEWDPIADEINYPRVLNRLLPPDIRVLAWAPTLPANFSARFSCWERQYRYFFTQPAFTPLPASLDPEGKKAKAGWLDIDAMREAAKLFEGVHDFRNFCKVDGAKQITNFTRRVFEADVVEVKDTGSALPYLSLPDFKEEGLKDGETHPKVYYFHVRGSAFLWHQIRHMVAILFIIGQGLEKPSLVTDLLDVEKYPRKPNYTMADEVPLVLWDCIFPKEDEALSKKAALEVHDPDAKVDTNLQDAIDWVWLGEDRPSNLHGPNGMVDNLWECWRERKMDELLANQLLDSVAQKANLGRRLAESGPPEKPSSSQRVYEGGNTARATGTYVPVLKKQLLATPEEVNDKWAQSKGFANAEELAKTKNWRSVIKANKTGGDSSAVDSNVDE